MGIYKIFLVKLSMGKEINWEKIISNYGSPTIAKRDLLLPYFSNLDYSEPILDLGCGNGLFAKILSKKFEVIGLDIHENSFDEFKYIKVDAEKIPLADCSVGDVLLINVFSCIGDLEKIIRVLKEVKRVKKENSKVYVVDTSQEFAKEEISSEIFSSKIIGEQRIKIKTKKVDGSFIEFEDNVILYGDFRECVSKAHLKVVETKDFVHPLVGKQIYRLWILQ